MATPAKNPNNPAPPAEKSAGSARAYVGHAYSLGIEIPEEPGNKLRPAEWDKKQIDQFITRYPRYAHWFGLEK